MHSSDPGKVFRYLIDPFQPQFVDHVLKLPSTRISKIQTIQRKEGSSFFWMQTIVYKTMQVVRDFFFGPSRNARERQYFLDLDAEKFYMENENIYYALTSLFPFLKQIFDYFECNRDPFQESFFDRCVANFFRDEELIIERLKTVKSLNAKLDKDLLESMWSYRKKISSLQKKDFQNLDLEILKSLPSFSSVDVESLFSEMKGPEWVANYLVSMTSPNFQNQKIPQNLILSKIQSELDKVQFWMGIAPSFSSVTQLTLFKALTPSEITEGLEKAFEKPKQVIQFLQSIDDAYSLQNEVYKIFIRDKLKSFLKTRVLDSKAIGLIYGMIILKAYYAKNSSGEKIKGLMDDVFCVVGELLGMKKEEVVRMVFSSDGV